jgi:glycosyltransferase involved in cell wall biosynthesis
LLKKYFNIDHSYVVPNFQPVPPPPPPKKEPIKVLWVANFKRLKQPELFIRLAQEFESIDSRIKFVMVGAPASWEHQWQKRVSNLIEKVNNLTYLGAQPLDNVNDLFRESHILINTSLYEGFSNTFIQAWFNEVPVISINCNPDDILEKNNIGLFCHGSFNRMISNLKKLIYCEKMRDQMGRASRAYAEKNHSLDNTRVILDLLRSFK